jgi:ribosome-binding factor A
MSERTTRVNHLLRDELSELLQREVKDPRIQHGLVSITEVEVSPDLRRANVFISHLGDETERDDVLRGLQHAAHFMHNELVRRLKIRTVPEFTFLFDPSIERGARLASLIHKVAGEQADAPDA